MENNELVAHAYNLASSANNDFAQGKIEEARTELKNLRDFLEEQLPKEAEEITD